MTRPAKRILAALALAPAMLLPGSDPPSRSDNPAKARAILNGERNDILSRFTCPAPWPGHYSAQGPGFVAQFFRTPVALTAGLIDGKYTSEPLEMRLFGTALRGTDNMADAFRHLHWMITMTRAHGPDAAWNVGSAAERDRPNSPASTEMDLANNRTGIALGLLPQYRHKDAASLAAMAIARGCAQLEPR